MNAGNVVPPPGAAGAPSLGTASMNGMQRPGGPNAPPQQPLANGAPRPPLPPARPSAPPGPSAGPASRPPAGHGANPASSSAGPSRMNSLSNEPRGPPPEIFRREYIARLQQRAGADVGVAPGDPQVGVYADRAVALVMQDLMRAVVRTKDHRLHSTYPRAPAQWLAPGEGAEPMWSLELEDEPYLTHALLVAQQQRTEREERRKRKIRMTDIAARKALQAAVGGGAAGRGAGHDASGGGNGTGTGTGTAAGSPADTTGGAPSPLPDVLKGKGKTAEEKAAAKAQRDAAKRAKDEAAAASGSGAAPPGAKKKGGAAKEPDINAANRSMGTHLAGVGKKRTFAWMPGTEGGELGGTLNAKFSLGGSKKRKLAGGATPIDAPWKPGGKAGLPKLGAKGAAGGDGTTPEGSRPTSAGRIDLGAEYGSIAHLVHGADVAIPPPPDRITARDLTTTLERFIRRGGPARALLVRRWEEALLGIAVDEQALARRQAAEVTTVFKVPPCHPGDEKAMKAAEEAAEGRAAAAAAAAGGGGGGATGGAAAGSGPIGQAARTTD